MKRSERLQVIDDARPDVPDLPVLQEADLDWDGVDCVLADLDDFTDINQIQGRVATGSPSPIGDIVTARDRLVAGDVAALQIVYRFADQSWVDTLLRHDHGARLLRMLSQR